MLHLYAGQEQKDRDDWCKAFTLADFPRCKVIALQMLENGSDRLQALKSLAQALHYMGNHSEARQIAEEVRSDAHDFFESSPVHPFVSASIVLARIAYFEGHDGTAWRIAQEGLERAKQHNALSICQTLAMACIPLAVWSDDSALAKRYARLLLEVSEIEQLGYWRVWGLSMSHAVDLHFDLDPGIEGFDFEALDALQSDHLAMLDGRTMSQLALDRVEKGLVGWTAPEVMRLRATTSVWYDPDQAQSLLTEARTLAECQGAVAWMRRIDVTSAALGFRFSSASALGNLTG